MQKHYIMIMWVVFGQTDLSDYVLDELVHGEGDVGVNGEHLSERILVLRRLHIPIQQITHHLQKRRVIILHIYVHWKREWEFLKSVQKQQQTPTRLQKINMKLNSLP